MKMWFNIPFAEVPSVVSRQPSVWFTVSNGSRLTTLTILIRRTFSFYCLTLSDTAKRRAQNLPEHNICQRYRLKKGITTHI